MRSERINFLAVVTAVAGLTGFIGVFAKWFSYSYPVSGGTLTIYLDGTWDGTGAIALAAGMNVGGGGLELTGMYGLAAIVNVAGLLFASGVALRFRSLQATSARERKRQLANARLLHELVTVMEEHIDLPDLDVPRFADHPRTIDGIEELAEAARHAWRLDKGPIPNVVRVLERHGIVVVRAANFAREIDAFSVRHEGRPIVVLGTEKAVTARSRFDAAHELAHLVLHQDTDAGQRQTENEAHQFAAAFLMPRSEIHRELPTTADWGEFMKLKVRWRVSIAALLRRARTLDVMPQHRYVNAMKTMSARGWRTREPGDEKLGSLEAPVLLQRALDRLADAGVGLDELAQEASLPLTDLQRLVELTRDQRPRVEL